METSQIALGVICSVLGRRRMPVEQVYLFGSRARGEAGRNSDWDFYVLVDGDPASVQRHQAITEIKRELARLRIPNDVILVSARRFERTKDYPGHLGYDVAREGAPML